MTTQDCELTDQTFELVSLITRAIYREYGYERLVRWDSAIPIEHRIADFTLRLAAHGECEGYVMVLGMECEHRQLAFCFRELQLPDLAQTMDDLLSPIPAVGILGDLEKLEQHFGSWDNLVGWISPFEDKLFSAYNRIVNAIANYCRSNAEKFIGLSPEIEEALRRTAR